MPVSPSKLLEGKVLAVRIQDEIRAAVREFSEKGWERPHLTAICATCHSSSDWYVGQQEKMAGKLGIGFDRVPASDISSPDALLRKIRAANEDMKVHGIFVTLPLPEGFDADAALLALDLRKDVEGMHPANLGLIVLRRAKLVPPTAYAAFCLIEQTGIALRGKKATIVGQSAVVGRPLQLLLGEKRVTTIVCNTGTPAEEIARYVSESDIVVACAGRPGIIRGDWIRPGAVVIDVGTTEVDGKLTGDVEFDKALPRAGFITPVPGGVGPLTVTMLMQNLIHAYRWQRGEC